MTHDVTEAFDECERIGVVGSPSSTNSLIIDLLGTAVDKRLVGNLCAFNYKQEGVDHFALGQVSEVRLRNPWVEDPTMRGLIRQKGRVDPITEKQDTLNATIHLSAVFSKASVITGSMLGTVPPTGTSVRLANEKLLHSLLGDYESELFYLGHAYGTGIPLPMWFKHFGKGKDGAGEAYHLGIFGKTGSGKSVLAKMILLGYARHRQMSIIVLDPQGEFSKMTETTTVMKMMKDEIKRDIDAYDLSNIILTDSQGYNLFLEILAASDFYRGLGIIHDDNKARAGYQIRNAIRSGQEESPKPWDIFQRPIFDRVWKALGTPEVQRNIYSMADLQARLAAAQKNADVEEFYGYWAGVGRLFAREGRTKYLQLKEMVGQVVSDDRGVIVVIDLSETNVPDYLFWNDKVRLIVIKQILDTLTKAAEARFKEGKLLNTLVVVDEAHRLAPKYLSEEDIQLASVRRTLVDGALTTRKFGLGWMFISPTLSSIDSEVIGQLRIEIFGFGLGWGIELRSLRELVGRGGKDDALSLYQNFKDPQSTLGQREYSFMAVGPISPLSFSGAPMFFTALNYPDKFLEVNAQTGDEK